MVISCIHLICWRMKSVFYECHQGSDPHVINANPTDAAGWQGRWATTLRRVCGLYFINDATPTYRQHGTTLHWDANQIRNPNPQHFFLLLCIPLSLLRVCMLAKSTTMERGKPGCITTLGGYLHLVTIWKISHQFVLLFNRTRDNWMQLCVDRANNLI
jgi:hypothetical protein